MTPEEKKESQRLYQIEYKKRNREKLSAYQAEYRKANRDKVAEYNKSYYKNNAEAIAQKAKEKPLTQDRKDYHHAYYEANKEKLREYGRKWYRDKGKNFQEDQRALAEKRLVELAGRPRPDACEVCGGVNHTRGKRYETRKTVFDHDHATGEFRGWLCDACNVTLGLVKDDTETLGKLVAYLKRNGKP